MHILTVNITQAVIDMTKIADAFKYENILVYLYTCVSPFSVYIHCLFLGEMQRVAFSPLAIVSLSVCLSVCHFGGPHENGLR